MSYINRILEEVKQKNQHEPEFIQAVSEVLHSLKPLFERHPEYESLGVLERLVEPEKMIMFKVPWETDDHKIVVNRGFRIQYNSAIGPYKGGLRFDPSVNLSVLKFLGFEQVFKNALTTLPMGGGKGGSDFNPKGKSDHEIRRFCESFMTSLYQHIGADKDVPAGDIGVSAKEIGYLFGQYKRLKGNYEAGVLTGKGLSYGGSLIRPEATGYGLVYFVEEILKQLNKNPNGLKVIVSGSGNVATFAAKKCQQLGMKVVAMSDREGCVVADNINVNSIIALKSDRNRKLSELTEGKYYLGSVFDQKIECDLVLACATQNEIDLVRAKNIVKNGCFLVAEGANMPNSNEAIAYYLENGIYFAPGKAANAGGVAVSGLEMSQNSQRLSWSEEEVDQKLKSIMKNIHTQCLNAMKDYELEKHDYVSAANLAGAEKVIGAMLSQGVY